MNLLINMTILGQHNIEYKFKWLLKDIVYYTSIRLKEFKPQVYLNHINQEGKKKT